MTAIENALVATQKVLVALLMAVAFVCLVVMVPVRYFDLPVPDLGEVSIAAIATLAFLCIGLLVRTGGHIAIEVADLVRPRRAKFVIRQLTNIGILLFVGVFGIQAYALLSSALRSGESSIALHIPLAIPMTALVVGLVLAAFHTLMNVTRDIRILRDPNGTFPSSVDAPSEAATDAAEDKTAAEDSEGGDRA